MPGQDAGRTILVVDDDPVIRLNIADYIRNCGFRVVEASGAAEAIQVIESKDVTIDVVFSELRMAGEIDGLGLSHWLRMNNKHVPLIFTSSYPVAVETEAVINERRPFIAKPYDEQNVLHRITSALKAT